jgi:hypothetical protein
MILPVFRYDDYSECKKQTAPVVSSIYGRSNCYSESQSRVHQILGDNN